MCRADQVECGSCLREWIILDECGRCPAEGAKLFGESFAKLKGGELVRGSFTKGHPCSCGNIMLLAAAHSELSSRN